MIHNRVIEGLVAQFFADLDHAGQLMRFAFAHEICDGGGEHEHFQRGDTSFLIDAFEKVLRHDASKRFGQGCANLVLLFGRENVDDTIDRLGSARRVQSAKNKVACAGGGDGQFDGFKVAHFAHQHDVRVFAQRAAKHRGKRLRVQAYLAMVYQATFALVDEFDRVFDGDDVIFAVLISVIEHRRQSGRFAGPSRASDYHQAALEHGKFLEDRRQGRFHFLKILEGKDLAWDLPEYGADAVLLVEEIGAKAGDVRNFVSKIDVASFFEKFDLIFGSDLVEHGFERVVLQGRKIDTLQFAPDAQDGRVARGQMQIGGILLEHQIEEGVNFSHTRPCRVAKVIPQAVCGPNNERN